MGFRVWGVGINIAFEPYLLINKSLVSFISLNTAKV